MLSKMGNRDLLTASVKWVSILNLTASSFSEGFERIFVDNKVLFIDTKGSIVIPPKFDSALRFSEGFSIVTIGGKQGCIDEKGNIVINPAFYRADDFKMV